jgi:hypothetical protein
MKKTITLLIFFILVQLTTAQTATIQSIDAGGESTTGSIQAVYSIGETVVSEYSGSVLKVSEGFVNDVSVEGTLSIQEEAGLFEVRPYPNPTQNHLYIDYPSERSVTYHLYDPQGKRLFSKILNGPKHRLDISNLSIGIYIIQATHKQQSLGSFKIIKN